MRGLKVIAVVNTKGGVGKTTLARALAVAATKPVKRVTPLVAMIDLDPLKSLDGWFDLRSRITDDTTSINKKLLPNPDLVRDGSLEQAIQKLEKLDYSWLFVDTPPAFIPELEEAAALADFVVIPTRPDIDNVKASRDAIVITRRAIADRFLLVINGAPTRGSQETATRAALASAGVPVAKQTIWYRISHSRAADQGQTAAEIDADAAQEIGTLWDEIRRRILAAKASGS